MEAELLIRRAPIKQEGFDLGKEKETLITARQEITSTKVPTHLTEIKDLEVFLQACMKLLRNQQAVATLQALIDSCMDRLTSIVKLKDVHKLYNQEKRTGREMWLTAQIGNYEMNQVIVDLGSDANVLPKQTWV